MYAVADKITFRYLLDEWRIGTTIRPILVCRWFKQSLSSVMSLGTHTTTKYIVFGETFWLILWLSSSTEASLLMTNVADKTLEWCHLLLWYTTYFTYLVYYPWWWLVILANTQIFFMIEYCCCWWLKDKGILSFHTLGSYFNWIPWFLIMLIILLKYELCSKIYILRHLFQIGSDDTKVYKTLHIYEFQPHILKSKPSICRKTTTIVNDEFVCRQIARSRFLFH